MDYSKIRLANERNSHVTKRLNRLNAWQFFKVVYRDNIWRLFGYNFLMLICIAPIFAVLLICQNQQTMLEQTLPILNSFGFSTGVWTTVSDHLATEIRSLNIFYGWLAVASSALVTIMLSGGLAVIRDTFWTGKMSTVGVLKSMWKGIKANILYAFVSTAVIALSVFGIYAFYTWLATIKLWIAIVVTIVLAMIALLLVMYLLILCSVSVTYKQPLRDNLDDSWRLMWLNILPNLLHVLLTLVPIALYFIFQKISMLALLYAMVLLIFGGMYCPFVWHTHMMKTFALFHPVEVKKKKQTRDRVVVEEEPAKDEQPSASKKASKSKKQPKVVKKQQQTTATADTEDTVDTADTVEDVDTISQSEVDAYATDHDVYATEEDTTPVDDNKD